MDLSELSQPAAIVAPRLLGCLLVRELEDGTRLTGRIVETEAYDQTDAASHSYKGRTPRTEVMFGPSGFLYVYFTYGMHYCMNIVCGPEGEGAAVLLRAVEPLEGKEIMVRNRAGRSGVETTNGPAKICQAFAITGQWSGHDMRQSPFQLMLEAPLDPSQIVQTTRIGISQAKDVPWRFYEQGNPFVSKRS
jgi:DNA-3-methyladenine glycosylase